MDSLSRTLAIEQDLHPKPHVDFTPGTWVEVSPGRKVLVPAGGQPARRRKMDNKDFVSTNFAPAACQVDEWNRRFGGPGSGVKFYVENGVAKARFKDRATKFVHMAARGMVDFDEVRSR